MNAMALELILYTGAIGLVAVGVAGLVLGANLFRLILALAIAEAGANLLLVLAGYRWDAVAPILTGGEAPAQMVDPVPQAMVLTAIVIGVGIQALAVAMAIRIRRAYGTLDVATLRARMEEGICDAAGIARPGSLEKPAGERPLTPPVAVTREADA